MTDTSYLAPTQPIPSRFRGAPHIAGTALAFTEHRYDQDEVARELTEFTDPAFTRFARTSGVEYRNLALPLTRYPLHGFTEANTAYLEVATELGERAVRAALVEAHLDPAEVDVIVTVSSTGVAVPTLDARMASRLGLRPDVKRIPIFGLGCVAGAAGLARVHDYLRGFPDHVAVLLSVELCSLTLQPDDTSIPALIGLCLFGDGAAAVVSVGAQRSPATPQPGPRIVATRSRLFPDTVEVMGWNVGSSGFQLVLGREVPEIARDYLGDEVHRFLDDHGLTTDDIATWVCHPGGPKVLDAVQSVVDLPPGALRHSWESMREHGNISSASVLDVLDRTTQAPPPPGSFGVMVAMGPGFSFELLLLSW
ncbi:3-oxoacyl-[acyl-carrier-protein] synthase III C-terminal domain-containing protein [Mycobacterium sp. ITM-2016-00317]|uniref:type III polyketide synthase n=1 Tax=Mycobacterium sp. ITM-2016-00317 TaxID=2099694 RepID=UPI00287FCFEA|nr:3-oxoacyl-[acyl-carrier-protein] synthase III C-terminal domain-containing protein [Mycobacterium sp. ITM-2016-00317]WNG88980.1 3-oxoacyl-[acyl-carrier-protein] synthase III C-terminal domain-containing protein [Mycobacterium sp. ITM-2016-00317]